MTLVRIPAHAARLTDEDRDELQKSAALPDERIDYSDIPPLDDDFFRRARPGVMYRPDPAHQASVTLMLEADVAAWLLAQPGWQGRANAILKAAMSAEKRQTRS